MRTNWKCRYFLLTGDHLHYFEPQLAPKGSEEPLLEPSPNAVPLGSISLHAVVGTVHKSDLGIVFCFQVPTAGGRTYHIKAPSAKSVERWLVLPREPSTFSFILFYSLLFLPLSLGPMCSAQM